MTKLTQSAAENQKPAATAQTCPDCQKPVDTLGPCWIRVSADPTRTRAWHLECRDRVLREQQTRFRAALELLTKAAAATAHVAKSVEELEALFAGGQQ